MVLSYFGSCAILEVFVVLFQVMGVLTLALSRLVPSPAWWRWSGLEWLERFAVGKTPSLPSSPVEP